MICYRNYLLAFLVVFLAGCYSTGRQFERPDFSALQIKKTTMSEIIGAYGQPASLSLTERNDKTIERVQYSYYTAAGFAMGKGPLGRQASFYFSDGVLIGYLYTSSYPGDSTDFDISKAKQIIKGTSTRKDVEAILGPPSGEVVFPLVDSKDEVELRYYNVGTAGVFASGGIVAKQVAVVIGNNGIVKNVSHAERRD